MAKKRATNKSTSKSSKAKVKKGLKSKSKTSLSKPKVKVSTSKPKGKKRGRKPSTPNRYNAIKSAISEYYQRTIGRNVKRFEMKVIYQWVKQEYGKQSVKYVVMNIDLIVDTFWKEYCNLYPVDLQNHARLFDWYYLKDYLSEEKEYHYPTDTIQVDLSAIGGGLFEFFMEDYVSKCDAYYAICTELGIRSYDYPRIFLKDAFCDISKKGNLYQYVLVMEEDFDTGSGAKGQNKPLGDGKSKSEGLVSQEGESSPIGSKTSSNDINEGADTQGSAENTPKIDSNEGKSENKGKVETKGESSSIGSKTLKKEDSKDNDDKNKENEQEQNRKNKELELEILKQKEKEAIAQKELLKQKTQTIIELKKAGLSIQEIKELLG